MPIFLQGCQAGYPIADALIKLSIIVNICITPMPPKKEEKKQIIKLFEPKKFWAYIAHPQDTMDKLVAFLTNYEKQLVELISQERTLEHNFEVLCEKVGVAVHPALQNLPKEESKFPELKNTEYGARMAQIMNYKIDGVTLRLFGFLITHFKLNSLKLSRNEIQHEAEHLKKLLEKENSITTLFLEWNPLASPIRRDVFLATVRPSLQHLILRQNNIGDAICIQIIEKIKSSPQIVLKSLDLTGNQLTTQIAPVLCKFVEEDRNIQFLGLSKNKLYGNQFLNLLFSSIGEVPVTEQDYAKYLETVKARDEVIEKNKKKKKGQPEEPLPLVLELRENERGRFLVKNQSLQNINLAKNGIGDSSANAIRAFTENQGKNIQLLLDGNKLSKKSRDLLQPYPNILL